MHPVSGNEGLADRRRLSLLSATTQRVAGTKKPGGINMAAFESCQAHRNNINRYQRLLKTHLSDLERNFLELRLWEEHTALRHLDPEQPDNEKLVPDRLSDV
jgi:hypothetical protein